MLSNKARYGLKALLYLAEHPDRPSRVSDIAQSNRIPRKFLDVILLEMKHAGLLQAKKGTGGGYQLIVRAEDITVGNVIRLLDGPLAPVACASRTAFRACPDCDDIESCRVRALMVDARDAIARVLDGASLADMKNRSGAALFVDVVALV
jgi:Rrf2 family protein